MKQYIKSDNYTYDQLVADTKYILKQYGWELRGIDLNLGNSIMTMFSPKYNVLAGYSVEHKKDRRGDQQVYTNCYLIELYEKLDVEKLYALQRQLLALWNDIDEAMGIDL